MPPASSFERECLRTPDGDQLELEWQRDGAPRLALLTHGLEGSTSSGYLCAMADALRTAGWDVLAWNMRGCGREPNLLASWYHSGKSDDLALVVARALREQYAQLALVGFSVGGNITLKYLGEEGARLSSRIVAAVAASAPVDLASAAAALARRRNRVYMNYFLESLVPKMRAKSERFPGRFDLTGLDRMRTFREFDAAYTAPFHGFTSVEHYWAEASSKPFLLSIAVPTLLVNAIDDPFLAAPCYPFADAEKSTVLFFEAPRRGGHVGFLEGFYPLRSWLERRTVEFLEARR